MSNSASKKLVNPFTCPDHVVDLFIDCEFVDQGTKGTALISFGAMVCGSKSVKSFYGIDTAFFRSPVFMDHMRGDDEQSKWMRDHVYVHIRGTAVSGAEHKRGRITELLDILKQDNATFTVDFDQTYPVPVKDWTPEKSDENDPDVLVVGSQAKIAAALEETIKDVRTVDSDKDNIVRTWGYYSSNDFVLLQNLHGGMLSMPEHYYYFNYDLRALGDIFGYSHDDLNCDGPHHALSDAIEQYQMTQKLRGRISEDFGTRFIPNIKSFW